jgi:hypothetical protein
LKERSSRVLPPSIRAHKYAELNFFLRNLLHLTPNKKSLIYEYA